MPLRSPPETQAKGHNRPRSSSAVSDSTKNGSSNAARKRPLSLLVTAGRAPLAERSPNATPVPTTPTNATINKRVPSLLPSLTSIRRVSAPVTSNVEKQPSPPQTRAAAARESFPSRPSAPIPESAASSVASSIRSMKKRTEQDDASLAAPRQQPTEPLAMSFTTAFHNPPTTARRGQSGTPRRTISTVVRSPVRSSEHESSVSGPPRRPGLQPRQTLPRPSNYQVPAKTPPRLASTTRGALALSPSSHADSSRSDTTNSSVISAMHFMSDPNMPQSNAPSVWEGDEDASTTFEMETEVAELNDMVDEDVGVMLDSPTTVLIAYYPYLFTSRLPLLWKAYKWLTRRPSLHTSVSWSKLSQILHRSSTHCKQSSGFSEPRWIRNGYSNTRTIWRGTETAFSSPIRRWVRLHVYDMPLTCSQSQQHNESMDIARALRGDGRGAFNEIEVRRAVRALRLQDRMQL